MEVTNAKYTQNIQGFEDGVIFLSELSGERKIKLFCVKYCVGVL